ncbi:MAG: TldD/PmbA family protein [Promethearchaeota archaeon]|nr:MAG: TldD/PmbA family protein [Candidatus Lokiarchaeota archaeon]
MIDKSDDEIIALFEDLSNSFKRSNQYFDILYDSNSIVRIVKSRSEENISINAKKSGIVARTFVDAWHEKAIQEESGLKTIETKFPRGFNNGEEIAEFEGWKINKEIKPKIDPSTIPIDEKMQKIRELFDYIKNFDKRIINPIIGYGESITTRIFVNNEGCQLRQVLPRIRLFIQPVAKEGSKIDFDYFSIGAEQGYELIEEVFNKNLDQIIQNSLDMLNAENPPSGKFPIILDPDMAGLIAHESFGHGLEADQVLRDRSYLKEHLGKKVASDICVICDAPNIEGQYGSYFFDDEGIRAGKNILVKNGILKDFIHNRRTASVLKSVPKGNGRRETFAHPVFVRMTNTYFEPGDYKIEEMISELKNGVILIHGYFGMEDPLGGGMQCTSKKGYLVENGEKTKLLKAITLSGSVLELLKNIDAISDDKLTLRPGTCGKGEEDFVPVTSGGSYVRVKSALISPG